MPFAHKFAARRDHSHRERAGRFGDGFQDDSSESILLAGAALVQLLLPRPAAADDLDLLSSTGAIPSNVRLILENSHAMMEG